MDALTRAAVTGKPREAAPAGDLPTDDLLLGAKTSPERALLLRAGMRAVYRAAGRRTETGARAPVPAPEETLPACSAKAAELVHRLLVGRRDGVLREALERLRLAGLRLPHALLAAALDTRREESRPAVAAVLGERGRWLAAFNPDWAWSTIPENGATEGDEAAWEEGALQERLEALRRVRGWDRDRGLGWVEKVWESEKADARAAFVETLEHGLSFGDEAFLERALDDRSAGVREAAATLLARMPGSAYAERATARADSIVVGYEAPAGGVVAGLTGRSERLVMGLPGDGDRAWKRDLPGVEKPPHGVGEKAWKISLALAAVPPTHWEERFSVGPSRLVAAARGEWEAALITGWCRATAAHQAGSWALPLWEHCYGYPHGGEGEVVWAAALPLAGLLSSADLAEVFPRLAGNGLMPSRLASTLRYLPGPWDETFSDVYLAVLQEMYVDACCAEGAASRWPDTLQVAAERLSIRCLARFEARMPVFPDENNGPCRMRYWRRELEKFQETLELRCRLVKEIPL